MHKGENDIRNPLALFPIKWLLYYWLRKPFSMLEMDDELVQHRVNVSIEQNYCFPIQNDGVWWSAL